MQFYGQIFFFCYLTWPLLKVLRKVHLHNQSLRPSFHQKADKEKRTIFQSWLTVSIPGQTIPPSSRRKKNNISKNPFLPSKRTTTTGRHRPPRCSTHVVAKWWWWLPMTTNASPWQQLKHTICHINYSMY